MAIIERARPAASPRRAARLSPKRAGEGHEEKRQAPRSQRALIAGGGNHESRKPERDGAERPHDGSEDLAERVRGFMLAEEPHDECQVSRRLPDLFEDRREPECQKKPGGDGHGAPGPGPLARNGNRPAPFPERRRGDGTDDGEIADVRLNDEGPHERRGRKIPGSPKPEARSPKPAARKRKRANGKTAM